jgi:hypothetical protein
MMGPHTGCDTRAVSDEWALPPALARMARNGAERCVRTGQPLLGRRVTEAAREGSQFAKIEV